MMQLAREVLNRFPALKALARTIHERLPGKSVSRNYVELEGGQAISEAGRLASSWQDPSLPGKQRELVDRQLAAYARGEAVDTFDVMRKSLLDLDLANGPISLLEVGCSSGYYSEIIQPVAPGFTYSGCDYSDAFIAMAHRLYPALPFQVQDATRLGYADNQFDVVVSGCCLLHIPDYKAAIAETARVASKYAIFHRTPVVVGQAEKVFRKQAYGVETVEIHFNEPDFLSLLKEHRFSLISTHTLSDNVEGGLGSAVRTYVCRKLNAD